MRTTLWGCILAGLLLAAGCGGSKPAQRQPVAVKTQVVAMVSVRTAAERYTGSVLPRAQVDLAFKTAGYVDGLLQVPHPGAPSADVQQGDVVRRGDVLARVQEDDAAARVAQARAAWDGARAGVVQARARVVQASAALSQARDGLLQAQKGHDQARTQVRAAEETLRQAESALMEARAAQVQAAQAFQRASFLFGQESITRPEMDSARASDEASRARLRSAVAGVEAARANLAGIRAQEVAAASRVPQAKGQIDGQRGTLEEARAAVLTAESNARSAEAALRQAELALEDCRLRAPFDAVVLARSVEMGSLVSAGTPGFTLADTQTMKVVFSVPDLEVDRLRPGNLLTVRVDALPDTPLSGRISAVAPAADPKTRVFAVEVAVPNPEQRVKSGMIASLDLPGAGQRSRALAVPLSALVPSKTDPAGRAVFVLEGAVARLRDVAVGPALGNRMSVLSGLKPGEQVVVIGATDLVDGETVRVVP